MFKWNDGRVYDGEFKNDKREGMGEHKWPDGRIYKGNWVNGSQDGEGSFYEPTNKKWIKGIWQKGKKIT